jgi:predicted CXXCH cytochrome family protein
MFPIVRTKKFFFAIAAAIVIFIPASDSLALEMSSKRDCVVCHVMWLNDFRTDQETLIDFEPGSVLMKDTQGVVSSEEVCYSCHDGYVLDSRHIAWTNKRHPVFVKPSKNITVPIDLPLSIKDEIYCGTCHSAHGKGAAPHGDPSGRTKVFREMNIDSGLCEKCHRNEADFKYSNGHPLHTTALQLPDTLFETGSEEAIKRDEVICQSCHRIHGARGNKILIMDNSNSDLCITCHEKQKNLIDTKHDLRTTLPKEKNIKQQAVTESGPCGACHVPHNAGGKKLWARPLEEGNPATQRCMTCHGDDTTYEIKRIGRHSHPINVKPSSDKELPEELPLFLDDGSKDPDGKVQCFTCHDIHRWDPSFLTNRGGKGVEGDSSNSFLRIADDSSTLCLNCHSDKKQVSTSDHNLAITAPDEKNVQEFSPLQSGPCGVCHIPHNAVSKNLWARELSGDKDFVSQLCTSCHNKNGAAKAKLLGDNYHAVDVTLDKFHITTTLPLYDTDGNRTENGRVVCLTCHNPHTWDPNKPIVNYTFKNVEGDARNSFLRKTNSPSSDLCKACHNNKAFVDGTDHDLNITNTEATNLLGQTVSESGQCGVCHLVHNAPNKIKLWGREYGKVRYDEDIVNALCNSCHSKKGIAQDKIPLIATHPEEKLVNNVLRNDRESIDFSPIFDKKTGKEVNVGNISCPSCHNAHQWSPLVKERGNDKNMEGNATNSFLRNVSYNNICIDCHGLDAIFRYKYFHDPVERVEPPPTRIKFIE